MATQSEKKLNGSGLATLWGIIKTHVSSAIESLSSVYSQIGHNHTKSDIVDLKNATDTAGGLMTDEQAKKLAGIQAGAEVNAIKGIQRNGTAVQPDATTKVVNISVPTKTSQLTNDDNVVKDASYVHTDNNYSTGEKSKLSGIASGAQVNVIDEIQVNGTKVTPSGKSVNITIPTDNKSLANGAGYQTESQVNSLINSKMTSTYKPQGSVSFDKLPTPASSNLGYVYNVTDAFTTNAKFVEGANKNYPAGTNVAIVQSGSNYMFDVMAGFIDTTAFATTDDVAVLTTAEIQAICV